MSHFHFHRKVGTVTEVGYDITEVVMTKNNKPTMSTRDGMVSKRVQGDARAERTKGASGCVHAKPPFDGCNN